MARMLDVLRWMLTNPGLTVAILFGLVFVKFLEVLLIGGIVGIKK